MRHRAAARSSAIPRSQAKNSAFFPPRWVHFSYAFECDFAQAGRDHIPPDAIVMITKSAAVQGDQDRCRLTSFTKTIR